MRRRWEQESLNSINILWYLDSWSEERDIDSDEGTMARWMTRLPVAIHAEGEQHHRIVESWGNFREISLFCSSHSQHHRRRISLYKIIRSSSPLKWAHFLLPLIFLLSSLVVVRVLTFYDDVWIWGWIKFVTSTFYEWQGEIALMAYSNNRFFFWCSSNGRLQQKRERVKNCRAFSRCNKIWTKKKHYTRHTSRQDCMIIWTSFSLPFASAVPPLTELNSLTIS